MRRKLVAARALSTPTARKRSKKKPTRQKSRRLMTMQDIAGETIVGNEQAAQLMGRTYRKGFELPEIA